MSKEKSQLTVWMVHPDHDYGPQGIYATKELAEQVVKMLDEYRNAEHKKYARELGLREPKTTSFYYIRELVLLTEIPNPLSPW